MDTCTQSGLEHLWLLISGTLIIYVRKRHDGKIMKSIKLEKFCSAPPPMFFIYFYLFLKPRNVLAVTNRGLENNAPFWFCIAISLVGFVSQLSDTLNPTCAGHETQGSLFLCTLLCMQHRLWHEGESNVPHSCSGVTGAGGACLPAWRRPHGCKVKVRKCPAQEAHFSLFSCHNRKSTTSSFPQWLRLYLPTPIFSPLGPSKSIRQDRRQEAVSAIVSKQLLFVEMLVKC